MVRITILFRIIVQLFKAQKENSELENLFCSKEPA